MPLPEGDRGGGLRLDGDHRGGDVILATPLLAVNIMIITRITVLQYQALLSNLDLWYCFQCQALLSKLDSIEVQIYGLREGFK